MGTPDFAATVLRHVAAWPGCEVVAAYCQPTAPPGAGTNSSRPPSRCWRRSSAFRSSSRSTSRTKPTAPRSRAPPRRAGRRRLRPHSAPIRAGHPDHRAISTSTARSCPSTGARPPSSGRSWTATTSRGSPSCGWSAGLIPGPCCCSARSASASTTPPPPCTTNWPISAASHGGSAPAYADGDPSTPIPQEEALATYAAKLTKADGHIDWDEDAAVIHARIRGVTPWPGAQTVFLLPGRDPLPALLQPGRGR